MSREFDDEQQLLVDSLQRRIARGQIDRRAFLHLASTLGIGLPFAEALADQAAARPAVGDRDSQRIECSYDYIVIGAGSAGCTLAARLSEDPGCRVLLIEAGGANINRPSLQSPVLWPSNFGTDVDWAYRTIPQRGAAERVIEWPRGRIIGGSSSINAMIWVWGQPADFDHWANAGNEGWDYAHLKPIFQRVETCARETPNADRGTHGPLHVEPVPEPSPLTTGFFRACEESGHQIFDDVGAPVRDGAGYIDFNTKDGQRFSVVHGFLIPALSRRNLTLLTGIQVEGITFEGNSCTGVRLHDGSDERTIVAERETILSAGVVESPRLLMLSGVGNADELRRYGITVTSNLPGVGENFQD